MEGEDTMNKIFGYHAKNLKTMEGHEGLIMRGVIMRGRTHIAEFFNDGNGGMTEFTTSVPNDIFEQLGDDLAKKYKEIGVEADNSKLGWYSAFDILIDDLVMLDSVRGEYRGIKKKNKWKDIYISFYSHKDKRLGFMLGGIYTSQPTRPKNEYKDEESFFLGTFDATKGIDIVGVAE